ncbi:MAG UNVERIFIED_CONTAM: GNAT family N-acetyltransferase [Microcystis novacekii LVE1205-3]
MNNPNFSISALNRNQWKLKKKWLEGNTKRFEEHKEWNYTILKGEIIVGGIGVKVNAHRPFIGEIGYFVDEQYWGQGIATEAVRLLEEICIREFRMSRFELLMQPENKEVNVLQSRTIT